MTYHSSARQGIQGENHGTIDNNGTPNVIVPGPPAGFTRLISCFSFGLLADQTACCLVNNTEDPGGDDIEVAFQISSEALGSRIIQPADFVGGISPGFPGNFGTGLGYVLAEGEDLEAVLLAGEELGSKASFICSFADFPADQLRTARVPLGSEFVDVIPPPDFGKMNVPMSVVAGSGSGVYISAGSGGGEVEEQLNDNGDLFPTGSKLPLLADSGLNFTLWNIPIRQGQSWQMKNEEADSIAFAAYLSYAVHNED